VRRQAKQHREHACGRYRSEPGWQDSSQPRCQRSGLTCPSVLVLSECAQARHRRRVIYRRVIIISVTRVPASEIEATISRAVIANTYWRRRLCYGRTRRRARRRPMTWFRKHHSCPCGTDWWDEWCSLCNDRCPTCDAEIEPDDVVEIEARQDVLQTAKRQKAL